MKNSHDYSTKIERTREYHLKHGSKNQFFPPVKPLELQIDLETCQGLFSWWLEVIYEMKQDFDFFATITLTGFSWDLMLKFCLFLFDSIKSDPSQSIHGCGKFVLIFKNSTYCDCADRFFVRKWPSDNSFANCKVNTQFGSDKST